MVANARLAELAQLIDRYSSSDGMHDTAIAGLQCIRASQVGMGVPDVFVPCLCVIVQGRKQVMLEEEIYGYEPSQYLAASVDLPIVGQVTEASAERPYLCIKVDIDSRMLSELIAQTGNPPAGNDSARGVFVGKLEDGLADAVLRLARLLDTPADIHTLAPLYLREVHYRLLQSEHGATFTQLAIPDSNMRKVANVIQRLRSAVAEPICIDELAAHASMSSSSLHHHFKQVTAMSPLQYQKRLRLTQARQIMLAESTDAATTAYRVGYESASQFSREYSRMFGAPPIRDIQTLRAGLGAG
ncbi:MAG: AraC family transcriptional regulator [Pseudomonadota bacterium]